MLAREANTEMDTEHQSTHVIILVVEDDPLVRELLQTVLTEEGYQVIAASNGEEALTAITTIYPSLMTLDLDLPGISGELILKELRQRDDTHELPVVIVSAKHPIPQEIRKLAQATVPKPFDIDKLLTVIRDIIPPPQQEQSIAKQ
jgi:DNA-binding response OmpR family regulator